MPAISSESIYLSDQLESIQRRAMRIIFPHLKYADISTLFDRRAQLSNQLFKEIVNNKDHKLSGQFPLQKHHHNDLRSGRMFNVPVCTTDWLKKSFIISHSLDIL